MFSFLKKKLSKVVKKLTKTAKVAKITKKIKEKIVYKELKPEDIEKVFSDSEAELIQSDVAFEVIEKIKSDLKKQLVGKKIKKGNEEKEIISALKKSLEEILDVPKVNLLNVNKKPYLILFLGFNGTGKTTSLAKLANWLLKNGKTCVIAAADTFRAASIEQLEIHGKSLGVKIIKHQYGADPAAVVFDAVKYAKSHGIDFVLADTAGRSHTNENLMEELKKIVRVNKPDMKILVIDSLTGNDAVNQAKYFSEVGVDALIFTKLDVNEKGGAILSVSYLLKKPILFLGTGQNYEDIMFFNKEKILKNLLGKQ